jgi:tight adherence protein B
MSLLVIAGFATLTLGSLLVAVLVVDHRRTLVRDRIGRRIGLSIGIHPSEALPRLDTGRVDKASRRRSILLRNLSQALQESLEATGGSVTQLQVTIAVLVAATGAALLFWRILDLPVLVSAPLIIFVAALAPMLLVQAAQRRYQAKFLAAFPDALDLIVRAVRAGLPVSEAIASIGSEAAEPVGREFRRLTEAAQIGADLDKEMLRAADRIRLLEFRFFIVALALQRQTGGNLAETIENLSLTIRRRRELILKAKALMAESKASAWLIGLLPFAGAGMTYALNRQYIMMLFADPRGKEILAAAIVSLIVGALIMRSMMKRAAK